MNWTTATVLYIPFGVYGCHLLHLFRFNLPGRTHISALPDYLISLNTSFWAGTLFLFPVALCASLLVDKYRRPWLFACLAITTELCSQALGRSLLKLTVDVGVWTAIGLYHILTFYYSDYVISVHRGRGLTALHAELTTMFRTGVTFSFFLLGTIGISVASKLIFPYFGGQDQGQSTAWALFAGLSYVAVGLLLFLLLPTFHALTKSRRQLCGEHNEVPSPSQIPEAGLAVPLPNARPVRAARLPDMKGGARTQATTRRRAGKKHSPSVKDRP